MLAVTKLADLADLADATALGVVLIGDALQYLPVGRGDMFEWAVDHMPSIELGRVRAPPPRATRRFTSS